MQLRHHIVLGALLAFGMLAVCGCSTHPPATAHDRLPSLPFSVVATGDPAADIRNASTFAWDSGLQKTGAEQAPENVSMDTLLQAAISETLLAKGYRYSTVPGQGDLVVSYRVVPAGALSNRELIDTSDLQLQPSLNLNSPDPARYEKGTLVIEVTDNSTGLSAWHSALQGFAVRELSARERRKRIGLMVERMLAGVPAK